MAHRFFTIGHSTRSVGEFVDLLRAARGQARRRCSNHSAIADQPSVQCREARQGSVRVSRSAMSISPSSGDSAARTRDVPADVNAFWENQSFHNYADYAMSDEFRSGLARLRELGHGTTSAMMCAEAVWWRCHRRIITDYLIAAGETVFHILGTNHIASVTSHSRGCTDNGWHVVLSWSSYRCSPIECSKTIIDFVCLA